MWRGGWTSVMKMDGYKVCTVGGKFSLLGVKPSLPSIKVKGFFVVPEGGIVMKSFL